MSEKQVAGGEPGDDVLGLLADQALKLKKGVISREELSLFLQRQNPFQDMHELFREWEKFYWDVFDLRDACWLNTKRYMRRRSGILVIPSSFVSFSKLMYQAKYSLRGLNLELEGFNEEQVDKEARHDRSTSLCEASWVSLTGDSDLPARNKSFTELRMKKLTGIPVYECLLLEMFLRWHRPAEYNDPFFATICSGSLLKHQTFLAGWKKDSYCIRLIGQGEKQRNWGTHLVTLHKDIEL